MRALILAFVGGLGTGGLSLAPSSRDRGGRRIVDPAGCRGLWMGLAPTPLARPRRKLVLGPLCSGPRSLRRLGYGAVLSYTDWHGSYHPWDWGYQ